MRETFMTPKFKEIYRAILVLLTGGTMMAMFVLLMLRVLELNDENFVVSLESVGGFFRDSSIAAFLIKLVQINFPKEAVDAIKNVAKNKYESQKPTSEIKTSIKEKPKERHPDINTEYLD